MQTAQSLDEGLALVVPLQSADVYDRRHDGDLVHVTGTLRTAQVFHALTFWCFSVALCSKLDIYIYIICFFSIPRLV